MQIHIIAVGRPSEGPLRELLQDYERRIARHAQIVWNILTASREQAELQIRSEESARISAQLKPNDTVVLLDERGAEYTNEQLVSQLDRWQGSQGRLVIIIGGAFGVDESLRHRAQAVWSLSKLVFPYEIVRLVLVEQLYRTYMIKAGHPYHHK